MEHGEKTKAVIEFIKTKDVFWLHEIMDEIIENFSVSQSTVTLSCRKLHKEGILACSERKKNHNVQYIVVNKNKING